MTRHGEANSASLGSMPKHLLDSLLEGCQVVGFDHRYLYVNEAAAQQGQITRDKVLGRNMKEAYPGIELTPVFEMLQRCLKERTCQQLENEFIFPGGLEGWFELRFVPIPEGVAILSQEVTGRKSSKTRAAHLAESLDQEKRYRALDEQRKDGVCPPGSEEKIRYTSPVVTRHSYTREGFRNLQFAECEHAEDLTAAVEGFMRTLRGQVVPGEFRTGNRICKLRTKSRHSTKSAQNGGVPSGTRRARAKKNRKTLRGGPTSRDLKSDRP